MIEHSSFSLILFLNSIQESGASAGRDLARLRKPIEQVRLPALDEYKEALQSRGAHLGDQGVLIETVGAGQTLAEHNPDVAFNPASVMKLATSLVALSRLGPDYRSYKLPRPASSTLIAQLEGSGVEGGAITMFALRRSGNATK